MTFRCISKWLRAVQLLFHLRFASPRSPNDLTPLLKDAPLSMSSLMEVQTEADKLSPSEKEQLITHLISDAPSPALDINDSEADLRDEEIDSGKVVPVSHEDFIKQVRG